MTFCHVQVKYRLIIEEGITMSQQNQAIEHNALKLPRAKRAHLVARLLDSLEDRPGDDPQVVRQAWIEEANRRYEAYVRGDEDVIPAEELFEELRAEEH
jgi:putative addiction module component (TIGR02574 family)